MLSGIFLLMGSWLAFAFGLLPGGWRQLFWRYITALFAAGGAIVAMDFLLAVMLWVVVMVFVSTSNDHSYSLRFLLVLIAVGAAARWRGVLQHRTTMGIRRLGDRMPGAQGSPVGVGWWWALGRRTLPSGQSPCRLLDVGEASAVRATAVRRSERSARPGQLCASATRACAVPARQAAAAAAAAITTAAATAATTPTPLTGERDGGSNTWWS